MKNKILLIFCLLIPSEFLSAQNIISRHYTRDDGLPSITLYKMIQDEDGFIWFGSDAGVTRFDGKTFKNFTVEDGLSDNFILVVKNDSKGRIWFLGMNGTVSYWYKGRIYNEKNDTILRQITSQNAFIDLYEDDENRLWFTAQYEYIILDKEKVRKLNIGQYSHSGIIYKGDNGLILLTSYESFIINNQNFKIRKIDLPNRIKIASGYYRLNDGSVLFTSSDGFIHQKNTTQKLLIPFPKQLKNVWCPSIALTKDSLLYAAFMGNGLYCFNLKEPEKEAAIYFENAIITGVLADKDNNIWVSTRNDGLFLIPEWAAKVRYLNKSNGLIDDFCQVVFKPDKEKLLVGFDKGVLQILNNKQNKVLISPEYTSDFNFIHRVIAFKDILWIATDDGLVCYELKSGQNKVLNYKDGNKILISDNIKNITAGRDKIYAAGLTDIFEYTPTENVQNPLLLKILYTDQRIYSMFCDKSERLWYSTSLGLQSLLNNETFLHNQDDPLLTKRINCIAETDDSVLILATHGYGVLFYKNGKIIQHLTQNDGICNDICKKLFLFNNRIYISTPSGVSILDYSNGKAKLFQNLGREYLLPCDDVYDVFADQDEIYIATLQGLVIIPQKDLRKRESIIPLLHITEIMFKDSLINPEGTLTFPYYKNRIKISYIGINYLNTKKVNYRYRIKEDHHWEYTTNNNLEFPKLKAGSYLFQLQARTGEGEWSPVKSFEFIIRPPFWGTLLFKVGVIILCLFLAYLIFKRYQKRQFKKVEEKQKIVKQIADLEQQALQTMLNPHFIFNVINSIQAMINNKDRHSANKYLADFALLIRTNLEISFKKYITLEDELEYLKLYVKFENMRLRNECRFEIVPDPLVDESEYLIPVMMIQPLLENAVIHGIMPLSEAGIIRLSYTKIYDEIIKFTVEDNGPGIDLKYLNTDLKDIENASHALSMTLKRLSLLEKSTGQPYHLRYFHLSPNTINKGTIAEITLPLK